MDEIDALRTLARDVAPPDPAAKHAARVALLAHAQASARRPAWLPRLHFRGGRRGVAGVMAAFALATVLVTGQLPFGPRPDAAAAAALNRTADVAAAQPAEPRVGYRRTKSTGAFLHGSSSPSGISVWALVSIEREIWLKPDGSGRLLERRGEPVFFGPADRAAWVAAGSPDLRGDPFIDERFVPAPSASDDSVAAPTAAPQPIPGGSLYFENVDALPTDVDALRDIIRQRAEGSDVATNLEMFTIVGDLLRETVAPPKLRAALYRVAAGLGGVELIGSVTDRAGRTGTAVSMTADRSGAGRERLILIFDPRTSVLLAEESILLDKVDWLDAEPPVTIGYNTYLASEIVTTIP